jgi:hypothetical protein
MFANDPVEPALEAARQREILAVYGQDEGVVENTGIEPVRQDQLDPKRPAVRVAPLLPFVDPGEAMAATFGCLQDGGGDRCRLKPVEARLEALTIARARTAADEGSGFRTPSMPSAARSPAGIARVDDLRSGPNQDIGVPDRGHAVLGWLRRGSRSLPP